MSGGTLKAVIRCRGYWRIFRMVENGAIHIVLDKAVISIKRS
jgi:hypothetical protein